MENNRQTEYEVIIEMIEERIAPFTLTINCKDRFRCLMNEFGFENLKESIYISSGQYIRRDKNGKVTRESAERFIDKIYGIAKNRTEPQIKQAVNHVINVGRKNCMGWDDDYARQLIEYYIKCLEKKDVKEEQIIDQIDSIWVQWAKRAKRWEIFAREIQQAIILVDQ